MFFVTNSAGPLFLVVVLILFLCLPYLIAVALGIHRRNPPARRRQWWDDSPTDAPIGDGRWGRAQAPWRCAQARCRTVNPAHAAYCRTCGQRRR